MTYDKIFNLMNEFEKYSYSKIEQVENLYSNNSDIKWHANCVSNFTDDNITDFYLNDPYSKKTRWDFWNDVVNCFLKHNIKTNLDLGCANNHFSFLCNKKNIFSLGLDPRENCIKQTENVFTQNFGNDRYGYIGTIKTFIEFFEFYEDNLFDCISILNFLHGAGHDPFEIKKLFAILPKISKYIIISEPNWSSLNLPKITDNYLIVDSIENDVVSHILYKLNP